MSGNPKRGIIYGLSGLVVLIVSHVQFTELFPAPLDPSLSWAIEQGLALLGWVLFGLALFALSTDAWARTAAKRPALSPLGLNHGGSELVGVEHTPLPRAVLLKATRTTLEAHKACNDLAHRGWLHAMVAIEQIRPTYKFLGSDPEFELRVTLVTEGGAMHRLKVRRVFNPGTLPLLRVQSAHYARVDPSALAHFYVESWEREFASPGSFEHANMAAAR